MKIHIVQKGDTLWEIAKKYNVDFEELKQLNSHLASPDMIMPGMKIRVPTATKTVKQEADKTKVKTMPAKKEEPVQKQEKIVPVPTQPPKLMHEKPITLPTLEGEEEHYPTTVFPEIQPKKEKTVTKKQEPQKAPVVPAQPMQPVQEYPAYQAPMPIEYPCYPPTHIPAYYSPCHQSQPMMMMMPDYMGCGCCGQGAQVPGYYPYTMQTPMNPMYNNYPPEGAQAYPTQMYPNQQTSFQPQRNEQEMFPMPPVHHANKGKTTTDKTKTNE